MSLLLSMIKIKPFDNQKLFIVFKIFYIHIAEYILQND